MDDELPKELQGLRQHYVGLKYSGDLPSDLGLARGVRDKNRGQGSVGRQKWSIARWAGITAAAAALAVAAVVIDRATKPLRNIDSVAVLTPSTRPADSASPIVQRTPLMVDVNPPQATALAATGEKASTDDSIPMWSDVDVNALMTLSTASAGLPATSLILPTVEEVAQDKALAGSAAGRTRTKSSL